MSLYENIHKRRKSGKKMRKKGDPGAPSDQDFKNAAKTSKENMKKKRMKKKKKGTSRKKLMIPNY
jgi:hypothetical protein